jgi:hypothetical protein
VYAEVGCAGVLEAGYSRTEAPHDARSRPRIDLNARIRFIVKYSSRTLVARAKARLSTIVVRWLYSLRRLTPLPRPVQSARPQGPMMDDPGSVSLRVSTENLNAAVELLRARGGLGSYPQAYQILVLERFRRHRQKPPSEIPLARATFEALPRNVQQLLMEQPG